jgi:hypothetical protein
MEEHGEEPSKDTEYAGFKVGAWLESQRSAYRKGKLNEDREGLLDQLGVRWGSYKNTERSWIHCMAACSAFFERHGKLPSQGDESPEGLKIGVWFHHQRRLFQKGSLDEDRKTAINNLLGDVLDPIRRRVERNLAAYKDYVEKTGKQPERRTVHKDVAIGNWLINSIRPKKDKLPTELVEKLDALGFAWETGRKKRGAASPAHSLKPKDTTDSWFRCFELSRVLMRSLKRKMEITDMYLGVNVGYWFLSENRIYAAGAYSPLKQSLFRSLILIDESHGWVFREWYWNYSHCLEFVLSNSSVPTKDSDNKTLPLGVTKWFGKQVSLIERGSLLARQENAMKELLTIIRDRESTDSPSV